MKAWERNKHKSAIDTTPETPYHYSMPPEFQEKPDLFAINADVVRLYKKYFVYLLFFGLLLFSPSLFMPEQVNQKPSLTELITTIKLTLTFVIISSLVSTVASAIFLLFIDQNEQGKITTLGTALKQALPRTPLIFITGILVGLIAMLGFFLFVIPGIIWGLMFSQATLFVLFKNQKIRQSLSSSKQLTKGHRWLIFRTEAQIILFGLLFGLLFLGIGAALSVMLNSDTGRVFNAVLSSASSIFLWHPLAIILPYAIWRALTTANSPQNS